MSSPKVAVDMLELLLQQAQGTEVSFAPGNVHITTWSTGARGWHRQGESPRTTRAASNLHFAPNSAAIFCHVSSICFSVFLHFKDNGGKLEATASLPRNGGHSSPAALLLRERQAPLPPFSSIFPEQHPWNLQEMLVSSWLACGNSCSRSAQLPLRLCIDSDGASSEAHRSSSHSPACPVIATFTIYFQGFNDHCIVT